MRPSYPIKIMMRALIDRLSISILWWSAATKDRRGRIAGDKTIFQTLK
jgi:hypothetical protein